LTPMTERTGPSLLIIKTGTTYPEIKARFGDFDQWFAPIFRARGIDCSILQVHTGEALPSPDVVGAVLITGSPAMVSDLEPWSEYTAAWLKQYVTDGGPTLGICYGHQLLAHSLGGVVADHPEGREIGTLPVRLTEAAQHDPIFGSLPPKFSAHLTHQQSVIRLPESAQLLASSAHEPHQAFRFGDRCWGVQFHPEFNAAIMAAYLDRHAARLRSDGIDTEALHEQTSQGAPSAPLVLERFADLIAS